MFCSPFDAALAERGPPAVFLLDREGDWRFAPNWTRDAWNVSGDDGERGTRWVLARDHDSGFIQFLLCTGVDLLREHVRHDLRHYATETEAREARAAFGSPPICEVPW